MSITQHLNKLSQQIEAINQYEASSTRLNNYRLTKSAANRREFRAEDCHGSRSVMMANLLDSQEQERKRISRELHDGLGQLLTHLKLQTEGCLAELSASGKAELIGDTWKNMEKLPALVAEAIQEVRSVCRALRPAILDDLGVLAAITAHCRKMMQSASGLQIETSFSITEPEIPEAVKTSIYRIVQEALNNCLKHAQAGVIEIKLAKVQNEMVLTIRDDGVGFDRHGLMEPGLGLISMRERVHSIQGDFKLESSPGKGTKVLVTIPLIKPLLS